MSNKPMSDDPKFREAAEYAARESTKEQNKLLEDYNHELKVVGAMDLYHLDRETAETLTNDVENLIAQAVKEERERTLKELTEWLEEGPFELTTGVSPIVLTEAFKSQQENK